MKLIFWSVGMMSRPLRIEYPDALYHVTSRGHVRNRIFSDNQDRENFLAILGAVVTRYNWHCHAYCLMDKHYHLMIETPGANLSIGMRQINGVYTQQYNRVHGTIGPIYQGRFKAILVQKENYLMELSRYVVLNPVRTKVVEEPAAWKWSSYCATAGISRKPDFLKTDKLLGLFSKKTKTARKQYQVYVRKGIGEKSLWGEVRAQVLLGEEKFIEKYKGLIDEKRKIKEIPYQQGYVSRPSLKKIFSGKESKKQRNEKIYLACVTHGYKLKEIADRLGIHYSTVSKVLSRQTENKNNISRPNPMGFYSHKPQYKPAGHFSISTQFRAVSSLGCACGCRCRHCFLSASDLGAFEYNLGGATTPPDLGACRT